MAGKGGAGSAAAAPGSDPVGPLCGAGGTGRPQALLGRETHIHTEREVVRGMQQRRESRALGVAWCLVCRRN